MARVVLVKVGDGYYSDVTLDVTGMRRMALLEALAVTRAFEVKLRNVALDECAVSVCASASKKAPSAEEEAAARALEGAEALTDLAGDMVTAALPYLYIHVQLPPSVVAGAGAGGESMHYEDAVAAQHARRASGMPTSTC
jgi:hypothetical protein